MKTMIRKKIYLLLLLIPLLHGCKESDFNDLLDRQGDQRKELQELTDLCKKLNEDIYNLQVIVNTDRIGDNITHIEELADGAGYTISFSKSAPITIRNGKKGDTGPDGDAGKDGIDGTDGKDGVDGTDGKDGVDGTDGTDGKMVRTVPMVKMVQMVRMVRTVRMAWMVPMAKMVSTVPTGVRGSKVTPDRIRWLALCRIPLIRNITGL